MKITRFILLLCFISNSLLGQKSNIEVFEDFIVCNIDTFLLENDVSKKELISEFEKLLIDNNFCTEAEIVEGYSRFYNYQKNPFQDSLNIAPVKLNKFPNLIKFRNCNIELLSVFLNIEPLKNEFLKLKDSNYVFMTLRYLDHLRMTGDVQPISFDISVLNIQGKLSDFSKLFLIMVFNSYSNYDFLLLGEKAFSAVFVEKAPIASESNVVIRGEFWLNAQRKHLKHSLPYENRAKILDKNGEMTIIKSKDYIDLYILVNENGIVKIVHSKVSESKSLCRIANKFLKSKLSVWQPAIYTDLKVNLWPSKPNFY